MVDFLWIAKFLACLLFFTHPRRITFIVIVFDFSNCWQTAFSKFVPYFCCLIGKSEWNLEKTNHRRLISDLVFQLNSPPFNSKLPGLYHLCYTWNSFDILPFEIEGTHSATNKTLVWQARGHEIKSRRRQKEMWCGRRKAIRWESIWKRRLCCRRQAINVHTSMQCMILSNFCLSQLYWWFS